MLPAPPSLEWAPRTQPYSTDYKTLENYLVRTRTRPLLWNECARTRRCRQISALLQPHRGVVRGMRNSTVPPCITKNKEDFSYCRGVDVLTSCQRCPVDSELSSASQDRLLSDEGFWGLGFGPWV